MFPSLHWAKVMTIWRHLTTAGEQKNTSLQGNKANSGGKGFEYASTAIVVVIVFVLLFPEYIYEVSVSLDENPAKNNLRAWLVRTVTWQAWRQVFSSATRRRTRIHCTLEAKLRVPHHIHTCDQGV